MRFRREREAEWAEPETILERALPRGLRALHQSELSRLPLLYRSAVSSLSVARKTAMDRALVSYLESLASRAYLAVYTSRTSERGALLRFFALGFPRAVRSMLPELALSIALVSLSAAPVLAQEDDTTRARSEFQHGVEFFQQSDFQRALDAVVAGREQPNRARHRRAVRMVHRRMRLAQTALRVIT